MAARIINDVPIGLSHSRVEAAGGPALKSSAPALSRRCEQIASRAQCG
jgi:hypothetical protein